MPGSSRYELPPDVMLQTADGEALLVKLTAEDMFVLNQTGAEIVQCLLDNMTLDQLVDDLVAAYDAPRDAVAADVQALIAELQSRGLLLERGDA